MPTTARHAFPTPAGSAAVQVPVDMKALADAIDAQVPYVAASAPPKVPGLIWKDSTSGETWIADAAGTTWLLIYSPVTSAGKLLGLATGNTLFQSTGGTGTVETMSTELALTIANIVAGQKYRIEYGGRLLVSAANTTAQIGVHALQGGTVVAGSPVIAATSQFIQQTATGPEDQYFAYWTPGASGSWNFKVGVKSVAGTGQSQLNAYSQAMFLAIVAA